MNYLSPLIRIVCGLVLIVVAATRYFGIRQQIAAADGGEIQIFGVATTGEPWQLMLAFGTAGLVGIALVALGGFSLAKKMQEN